MQLKGLKANFLGDSITEGVGTSAPEHIYLNVLQRSCAFSLVRNYGISGTRIARQKWCRAADQNEDNNFCIIQFDDNSKHKFKLNEVEYLGKLENLLI